MELITIRYKDEFRIEEKAQIYPLSSDIYTIGVIYEYKKLNGNNKYILLNDSIKLLEILSSKFLTIIGLEPLKVFLLARYMRVIHQ